jgi:hypothetical protein
MNGPRVPKGTFACEAYVSAIGRAPQRREPRVQLRALARLSVRLLRAGNGPRLLTSCCAKSRPLSELHRSCYHVSCDGRP